MGIYFLLVDYKFPGSFSSFFLKIAGSDLFFMAPKIDPLLMRAKNFFFPGLSDLWNSFSVMTRKRSITLFNRRTDRKGVYRAAWSQLKINKIMLSVHLPYKNYVTNQVSLRNICYKKMSHYKSN